MGSSAAAGPVHPKIPDDRFTRAKGVVGTRQGDTTVLLDVNGGMYYTLNEVGGRIWELIGEGDSPSRIVQRLEEDYDVAREQLVADVRALVDRLLLTRLIEPARQ